MEVFSKGVHRAMVPVDSHMESVTVGVELVESASSYQMLTQMDVLKFSREHGADSELRAILSRAVQELGAVNHNVYAITDRTTLIDAIRCLRTAMLNAVPIVTASEAGGEEEDHKQLIYVSFFLPKTEPIELCGPHGLGPSPIHRENLDDSFGPSPLLLKKRYKLLLTL